MSDFNPDEFLHQETGKMSTKVIPVPQGEWNGVCGKPIFRQNTIKKGERIGEIMTFMDVPVAITDQEVIEETKREKPFVRLSEIITLDDDGGISSAEGDNVGFGRLREALGLNDEETDFTPAMIEGGLICVNITHDPNPNDPESPYTRVKGVRAPN